MGDGLEGDEGTDVVAMDGDVESMMKKSQSAVEVTINADG